MSGAFTVEIFEGGGTGGRVLTSLTNVTIATTNGLVKVALSPVPVMAGRQYTFRVTHPSAFMPLGYPWENYAGGSSSLAAIAGGWDGAALWFQTFVTPKPAGLAVTKDSRVGVGTDAPMAALDVNGESIRIRLPRSPAPGSACSVGEMAWDATAVYVCVSPDHWKKATLAEY